MATRMLVTILPPCEELSPATGMVVRSLGRMGRAVCEGPAAAEGAFVDMAEVLCSYVAERPSL